MRSIGYRAVIGIMLLFNILLLYQNRRLASITSRPLAEPSAFVGQLQLTDVPLLSQDRSPVLLSDVVGHSKYTMLVFFSPSDCPPCFDEKGLWAEIPQRTQVPVIGIASSPQPDELWHWVDNSAIPIEVYLDTTYRIQDGLALSQTPMKVLVDEAGAVVWADPPREPGSARERFWEDLAHAIQ